MAEKKDLTHTNILHMYRKSWMTRKRLEALLESLPDPVFAYSLNNEVEYVNPAFERVFGWTLHELKGQTIDFIPEHLTEQAKEGMRQLYKNRSVLDFETQRLTKDGRLLDILINGALLYDENDEPTGQALILRDMTQEKRMAKSNRIMFNISKALYQYHQLGDLIDVITREIQSLIDVEGAFILLEDETSEMLYFLSAQYRDGSSEKQFKKIRFSADEGVSGRVFKTGKPLMIPDVSNCSFYLNRVDEETDLKTKNILSVPVKLKNKTIGVISVVNKKTAEFDQTDTDLLSTVASTIALPIENTRINEALRKSYQELKLLNKTKDQVINHLAHELKTPVSVLDASMKLIARKLQKAGFGGDKVEKIFLRGHRNLMRILDIQYEVEDLLKRKDFKAFQVLTRLLEACRDELCVLFENETENQAIIQAVEKAIRDIFGPDEFESSVILLDETISNHFKSIRELFDHRNCEIRMKLTHCPQIKMPEPILDIILTGLIRNAVEYTPDGSRIDIILETVRKKPVLTIRDAGIGITDEKLSLIFDNFFTPPESVDYSTKAPFDFNAGGRGFDLLRIKLFSEKYPFAIRIESKRCPVIPNDADLCPGDVKKCESCKSSEDCMKSGGTSIRLTFDLDNENHM